LITCNILIQYQRSVIPLTSSESVIRIRGTNFQLDNGLALSLKIIINSWFQIPFVGKDVYIELMKAKVKRDPILGFRFTPETNVSRALLILSKVLDERVEVAKSCFICEGPIEEESESGFVRAICKSCEGNEDAYDLYMMKFAKLMEIV
jgi:hypothetical protein